MEKNYEQIEHQKITGLTVLLNRIISCTAHCHKEIEIGYILEGETLLSLEGKEVRLKKGDIFIINPFDIHTFNSDSSGALILFIQCAPSLFYSHYPAIMQCHFKEIVLTKYFLSVCQEENRFSSLLILLGQTYFLQEAGYELKCFGLLNLIMQFLLVETPYDVTPSEKQTQKNLQKQRISRILDYINQNYHQKILLRDIAAKEDLSLYYLSHFFTANMNLTFQDYVNEIRFEHASHLIESTDKPLLEISYECGFSDVRYLYRLYQKHYQCTPMEHRKNPAVRIVPLSTVSSNVQKIYGPAESSHILNGYKRTFILDF